MPVRDRMEDNRWAYKILPFIRFLRSNTMAQSHGFNAKTILVCGGAGFIGSNFIRYVLSKYPKVKIVNFDKLTYSGNLDNLRDVERDKRYSFVKGDIIDGKKIGGIFKKYKPDYVINFAAETHVDRSIHGSSLDFIKTNIEGVFNIAEAVKASPSVIKYVQVSCYDEKTRAWTRSGLKTFQELKKGDEVLTLDKDTGAVRLQKVDEVIVQDYEGGMVEFSGRSADLLVTPNHRMFHRDLSFSEAEHTDKVVFPIGFQKENGKVLFPDGIKKDEDSWLYVLGCFLGDGFTAYQEKIIKNKSGLCKRDFIERKNSKGQFISGKTGVLENVTSKSWRVFFDVPENDKGRKRLEESLDRLEIKWSAQKGKSGEHVYLTSEKLVGFFDMWCGKGARNKKIPDFVFGLSEKNIKSFFDGMMDSDGYWRSNGMGVYTTVSEYLKDGMVELGVRLGRNVSVKKIFSENIFEGRIIKGWAYYVFVGNGKGIKQSERRRGIVYKGKVWCIKVKNKNFLVERNGKYAFCGNTDEVHGSLPLDSKERFNEYTLFAPNVPYAATKAGGDLLCRSYFSTWKVPVVVTHCSNNYGPNQYPEKIIPFFVTRMLEGKKLPLYGDGRHVRDWIYVIDHCRALELCLLKGAPGGVYHIGADNEMDNTDIARRILKYFGRDESWIEYVGDRPGHDRRYSIDPTKIREQLGWRPRHTFEKAFNKTIQWYVENPKWVSRVKKRTGVFNPHIDLWRAHALSNNKK